MSEATHCCFVSQSFCICTFNILICFTRNGSTVFPTSTRWQGWSSTISTWSTNCAYMTRYITSSGISNYVYAPRFFQDNSRKDLKWISGVLYHCKLFLAEPRYSRGFLKCISILIRKRIYFGSFPTLFPLGMVAGLEIVFFLRYLSIPHFCWCILAGHENF